MGRIVTLGNKIRLQLDPLTNMDSFALGLWVNAGARDESLPQNGIAHLLEHMAFKGTRKRNARDIAEQIESVGGWINAATSYQRTGYFVRGLTNDLNIGIDVLADIFFDAVVDEKELKKEAAVVLQEIGEAADDPEDVMYEQLQAAAFDGQSLGRPILGTASSVQSFCGDDLRAFVARYYRPENIVVSISGGFDEAAACEALRCAFDRSFEPAALVTRSKAKYVGGDRHRSGDFDQTQIGLTGLGVGDRHELYFASRILGEILGGGMASRLFQTIREERGLAYSVCAFAEHYDDIGLITMAAGTDGANCAEVVSLMKQAVMDCADRIHDAELKRAKAVFKANLLMALEAPMARAEAHASYLLRFGQPLSSSDIVRQIDAVTAEDVRECAKILLSRPLSLSVVGEADFGAAQGALHG